MTNLDLLRRCVDSFLQAEVAIVGRSTTEVVIQAVASDESLEFDDSTSRGRQNDVTDAIKLIFEFAAFVKTLLEVYDLYKKMTGRKPSPDELVAEVRKDPAATEPKRAKEIARTVIDQIDKK